MIFMNATLKNITAMLIFGSIGLFVRNIELASSQIGQLLLCFYRRLFYLSL